MKGPPGWWISVWDGSGFCPDHSPLNHFGFAEESQDPLLESGFLEVFAQLDVFAQPLEQVAHP